MIGKIDMPFYDYECVCGNAFEDIQPMSKCREPQPCPECGKLAEKVIRGSGSAAGDMIRISTSLGVHPTQVISGEANKIHPGAEFNKRGDMIIHSRTEKLQRMQERSKAMGVNLIEKY